VSDITFDEVLEHLIKLEGTAAAVVLTKIGPDGDRFILATLDGILGRLDMQTMTDRDGDHGHAFVPVVRDLLVSPLVGPLGFAVDARLFTAAEYLRAGDPDLPNGSIPRLLIVLQDIAVEVMIEALE
jgi:hypothetical protein